MKKILLLMILFVGLFTNKSNAQALDTTGFNGYSYVTLFDLLNNYPERDSVTLQTKDTAAVIRSITSGLQTSINSNSSAITTLTTGLSSVNSNITTMTGNISTLSGGLSSANSNISTMNSTLTSMNTTISNLSASVDNYQIPLFVSLATTTLSNSTTEATLIGTGNGSLTIPANYLVPGRVIRILFKGLYSTPTLLGIATLTTRLKLAGTTVSSGSISSLLASASNTPYDGEILITCRTSGTSGTIIIGGFIGFNTGSTSHSYVEVNSGGSIVTVNTTSGITVDLTGQYSSATTGNSISCHQFVVTGEKR